MFFFYIDLLGNIGIPLPSLPLGMDLVGPQIVFSDGYVVIESDVTFPFPRHSDWDYEYLMGTMGDEEE